jgi:NADPH-dependent F420 reductase
MNIGIIGAGNVGGTLGRRWARNGHCVVFASRDPQSQKTREMVAAAGVNASAGSNAEAASASEVLLLSTPFHSAEEAVRGAGNLSGKIVIDAVNPLLPDLSGLAIGRTESAAERVAEWAKGAKVVKAFNTVGYNIMENPSFEGGKVAMFYCGNDAAAKKTVASLIDELGFEALDAGPLDQARVLEPFAMLWISLAVKYGYASDFAFELLRRKSA